MMLDKKVIFWDFDGVIMDSMPIRDRGFEIVLADFPKNQVNALLDFHKQNGGLSRYVKFRHFFENILNQQITEDDVKIWAGRFSEIMKRELQNPELLIEESLSFIKNHYEKTTMHIVSGSDQEELRFLCKSIGIDTYFKSIHGSPTAKKKLVSDLLKEHGYQASDCSLIGDSINDYDAAMSNQIAFYGYNNPALDKLGDYIQTFKSVSTK